MIRLWYLLTAYWPRKLPANEAEWDHFTHVLVDYYGVPPEPRTLNSICSFVCSTPSSKIRRPWGDIANGAKRLALNEFAQGYSAQAVKALEDRLGITVKRMAEQEKQRTAAEAALDAILKADPELAASARSGQQPAVAVIVSKFKQNFDAAMSAPDEKLAQFVLEYLQAADLWPVVDKVLTEQPLQVQRYNAGENDKLMGFFVGQALKQLKGNANPALLQELFQRRLEAIRAAETQEKLPTPDDDAEPVSPAGNA